MERKIKNGCGIWIIWLSFLWTAFAMTGCTRREDVFLEEINSDENEEKSEESGLNDGGAENPAEAQTGIADSEETTVNTALDELVVTPVPQRIFVDVCGAVANPGVYELEEGARIFQAVDAAGGYLPGAAVNYLNRARSIGDGQQIYVPTEEEVTENLELTMAKVPEALTDSESAGNSVLGEIPGSQAEDPSGISSGDAGNSGNGAAGDSRIDLNTADADLLSTLSGIGQSKAAAIIAYREEHGGFASIEEIMNVEGIKEGTFSKIKDKISTG